MSFNIDEMISVGIVTILGLLCTGILACAFCYLIDLIFDRPNKGIEAKKIIAGFDITLDHNNYRLLLQEVRHKGSIDNELSLVLASYDNEIHRILTTDPIKFGQIIDELLVEVNIYLGGKK